MRELENAGQELERIISARGKTVAYGYIAEIYFALKEPRKWIFRNQEEFAELLPTLNGIVYDAGHGSQFLDGCVVFTDGSYLSRRKHDGSEWWALCSTPTLHDIEEDFFEANSWRK